MEDALETPLGLSEESIAESLDNSLGSGWATGTNPTCAFDEAAGAPVIP